MSMLSAFKFKTGNYSTDSEISEIYPLSLEFDFFVRSDIENIYKKILIDCVERTQGISEKIEPLLWDNCLESESRQGLISLLAEAMANKRELYLIYSSDLYLIRKADTGEAQQIKADYSTKGYSDTGVYISFKSYDKTDLLKIYSGMEYSVLNSLNKSMNLSKAIQIKMSRLRESVGALDQTPVVEQAKSIASALSKGSDILLDKEDEIVTSTPEMASTREAIMFLDAKRSFILSLPLSYINGEQTGGIGSTGEADSRAVERGLRQYWISIIKPALQEIFGIKATFKSQDYRQITSALEAVKTFELISEDLISLENKRLIVSKLFDIDNDLKGERSDNDDSALA